MAIIIDLAQKREVLERKPGRVSDPLSGAPHGEVVLFTGVRYERYETDFDDEPITEESSGHRRARKKKKS
ncbi:MAG: hypothetical protein KJ622_06220 [Alphaproteobacteria bacterium]|nr:hypothetical protein [Alphaproteobacteria bacterium]